ncbi:hypothetical protein CAPTEDRAFT_174749 [Capitella teleta]|uniref:Acyl-coenzyme A oxidase n=1 Tax=Capitella teleta TaxID=283909 RepID=R7UWY1_CAPTE|nr:hypothetical protein CAPTEDRAFT_174749 [Capitella teleta]|eukprot:ELU10772.1 hypothetical protein CAPTEDRAFT_174749 [Capitella teleta]
MRGYSSPDKTNKDLVKERNGVSFQPLLLTHVLDNGADQTDKRRRIEQLALSDPVIMEGPDYSYLSVPEKYSEGVRKHVHCIKKVKEHGLTDNMDVVTYHGVVFPQEAAPLSMHDVAFKPMFTIQASDQQKKKWLRQIENYEIIGNYAQTELAHGTYIRGLQTTAEYDPSTQEFIVNTPTLTATKWWIGTLGKSSNYALVMAQLITQGKGRGLHAFMVPIRDMNTHEPLPGITVGDIGPKLGFHDIDNGFLQMNNIRIPRENMLNAHSQVEADGSYSPPFNDKIMYAGMLGIRAHIPLMCARNTARACTIAIRYSLVRRQSELVPGGPEPQVLDFQTQQNKIFPSLAMSYAFWFIATRMQDMHKQGMEEVMQGNFSQLLEMHALSSAMKAYCTTRTTKAIETCRLACGGHGFSEASGLPKLYGNAAAPATAEGEATVLFLQNARYLMKCYEHAKSGSAMDTFSSYMTQKKERFSGDVSIGSMIEALAYRAEKVVARAAAQLFKWSKQGMDRMQAWNKSSVCLEEASIANAEYVLVKSFADYLSALSCDAAVKNALQRMCSLLASYYITEHAGEMVQGGYMTEAQLDVIRLHLTELYSVVRPDAVAYADGFDFSDRHLCSILGRYDGNVYEKMFEWAKNYPMNKTDVHESYRYLKELKTNSKL